jgi:hypothetical protein
MSLREWTTIQSDTAYLQLSLQIHSTSTSFYHIFEWVVAVRVIEKLKWELAVQSLAVLLWLWDQQAVIQAPYGEQLLMQMSFARLRTQERSPRAMMLSSKSALEVLKVAIPRNILL